MERRFFPLSVVTGRITELLQPAVGKQFWVKAEISSGKERNGAFYCDLVETVAGGKIVAKLSCTIWSRDLATIKAAFRHRDMDLLLTDGTTVGFLCSLQYSPQYGLSLKVHDADPAFAMGELELKKREIIERLQKEGLFGPNKERFVPMLPLRIGLVTSHGSAAYNDVLHTLVASGYGFKILVADALMQGEQTERSVLKAMQRLTGLDVELIVIARGGGSKTDLSFLDNESIARAIAACPLPVWTGIGHEIDTSVLDHVANRAFKTPTAIAEELVARFTQMRRQLDESSATLKTVWTYRLGIDKDLLLKSSTGVRQGTRKLLDVSVSTLRERAQRLRHQVGARIGGERLAGKGRLERLRSLPLQRIVTGRERVASKRQLLLSRGRFALGRVLEILAGMRQRFARERFLRRLQTGRAGLERSGQVMRSRLSARLKIASMQLAGIRGRLRLEPFRRRFGAERKSLVERMAILKAHDPQRVLERGFALVYREDGRLLRSIGDVSTTEKIKTHLADGTLVSEVLSKEEPRERIA